jgi:hypothetical protein
MKTRQSEKGNKSETVRGKIIHKETTNKREIERKEE